MRRGIGSALAASAIVCAVAACDERPDARSHIVEGGDPVSGGRLVARYGCGTCHEIPAISRANGTVGPPLTSMARQAYIGGILPNNPENLVRWIVDPTALDPRTAMPDLDMSEAEARDAAAYLYAVSQ